MSTLFIYFLYKFIFLRKKKKRFLFSNNQKRLGCVSHYTTHTPTYNFNNIQSCHLCSLIKSHISVSGWIRTIVQLRLTKPLSTHKVTQSSPN